MRPESSPATTAAPAAPPLSLDRLTIQVEMPAPSEVEKLVEPHADSSWNKKTRSKMTRSCKPCAPRQHVEGYKERVAAHGAVLCLNAINLFVLSTQRSSWPDLMTAAGFVDWPLFPDLGYTKHLVAASMVASALSMALIFWMQRDSKRLPWLFRGTTIAVIGLCFIVMFASPDRLCIAEDTVDTLSLQAKAVTTYNNEYCQAWCRHNEGGLAALARGDCAKEKTAFDAVAETVTVGDWCRDAIATRNYDLVANYSGVSPFAGLKGTGACLYHPSTVQILLRVCNAFASTGLFLTLI